jgi:hypothetical protein
MTNYKFYLIEDQEGNRRIYVLDDENIADFKTMVKEALEYKETIVGSTDGHDGGNRAIDWLNGSIVDYEPFNTPDSAQKACNCGAKHTSRPDYHSSWCDAKPIQ